MPGNYSFEYPDSHRHLLLPHSLRLRHLSHPLFRSAPISLDSDQHFLALLLPPLDDSLPLLPPPSPDLESLPLQRQVSRVHEIQLPNQN